MRAGFTLVEVLIVVGLIAVVASFTMVVGVGDYRRASAQSDRNSEVLALIRARAQAVADQCFGATCTKAAAHGVWFGSGELIIFQSPPENPDFAHRDEEVDEHIALGRSVQHTGAAELTFLPHTGYPVKAGTLTTTDETSKQAVVTVYKNGRIDW